MRKRICKKWIKGILGVSLTAALILTAAGCGNSGSKDKNGRTTLHINIMNEFTNIEKVTEEYARRVKDDPVLSKVDLEFTYYSGGDYSQKLSMAMSAQEDYDLIFIGTWHGLQNYISQDACADLASYFNNDEYPGLKKAFPEEIIESNMTYEKNEDGVFEKHLYRIPILEAVNDTRGLYIREDLRKKYNCPEIVDDETLEQFLKTIKEKEPKILPWSHYGLFYFESPYYSAPHHNIFPAAVFSNEIPFYVHLSDDYTKVLDVAVMGDSQEHFDSMPEGYQYDFIKESHEKRVKWAQYMDPSRADKDSALYSEWAVCYGTVSGYASVYNGLKEDEEFMKENPDMELTFYPTEKDQRDRKEGAVITEMSQGNNLVVPAWSEHIEETMRFLDWMFGSAENHDLFQYGIEGTDWEKLGEDSYRQLTVPVSEQYTMPGYSFTWNPTYFLMNETTAANPVVKQYAGYQNDMSTYADTPLSGFAFDTDPVRTQVANVSAKANEAENIKYAVWGDKTGEEIDKWHRQAEKAGLEDIRAEYIKQLQEFLDYKYGNQGINS